MKSISTACGTGKSTYMSKEMCGHCDCLSDDRFAESIFICKFCAMDRAKKRQGHYAGAYENTPCKHREILVESERKRVLSLMNNDFYKTLLQFDWKMNEEDLCKRNLRPTPTDYYEVKSLKGGKVNYPAVVKHLSKTYNISESSCLSPEVDIGIINYNFKVRNITYEDALSEAKKDPRWCRPLS